MTKVKTSCSKTGKKLAKALEKSPYNPNILEIALRGVSDLNKAIIEMDNGEVHTPLSYAASRGNLDAVHYLLEYKKNGATKVNPDACFLKCMSPQAEKKITYKITVLQDLMIWIGLISPLHSDQAKVCLKIVELLLEHDAKPDLTTEDIVYFPMMLLMDKSVPLEGCVRDAIYLLKKYKADLEKGMAPVGYSIVTDSLSADSSKAFMQKISEKNNGNLPFACESISYLQIAIVRGFLENVKILLELGARVDVILFGLNIMELAGIVNNQEIIELLKTYCKNLSVPKQKQDKSKLHLDEINDINFDKLLETERLDYLFCANLVFSGHRPDAEHYSQEHRKKRLHRMQQLVKRECSLIYFGKERNITWKIYKKTFLFKTWDDPQGEYPAKLAMLLEENDSQGLQRLVQIFWGRHYLRSLEGNRKIPTKDAYESLINLISYIHRQCEKNAIDLESGLNFCAKKCILDDSDESLQRIYAHYSALNIKTCQTLISQRLSGLSRKLMNELKDDIQMTLPILKKLIACQLPGIELKLDEKGMTLTDFILENLVDAEDSNAIKERAGQIYILEQSCIGMAKLVLHAQEAKEVLAKISEEEEWEIFFKCDEQQNIQIEFVTHKDPFQKKNQDELQEELVRKRIDGCFFEEEGAVIFEWTKPEKPQARPDTTVQVISRLSSASPVPSMPSISPLPPVEITPPRTTPKLKTRSAAPNLNAREKIPEPIEMQFEFKGTLKNGDTVTYCHPYRESKEEVTMGIFWMEEIKAFGAISPDVDDAFRNAKGIGIVIGERLSRELRVKMETGVVGDEGKPLKLVEDSERRKGIFNQSTALKVKWKGEFGTLRVPLEKVEVECSDGSKAVVYVARGFKWDKEREATKAEYFGELLQNRLSPRPY